MNIILIATIFLKSLSQRVYEIYKNELIRTIMYGIEEIMQNIPFKGILTLENWLI